MRISVIPVAKRTPKPRLTAMGIRNLARMLFSKIMGASPAKVVREVRMMALNRRPPV